MTHRLLIEHPDRFTYRAECTCGEWESTLRLDDIPMETTGVFETIATEELTKRHRRHLAEVDDLPT